MANTRNIWLEFTVYRNVNPDLPDVLIPVCGLCANKGIVNTLSSAITHAGINCGIVGFCICPNGRKKRRHDMKLIKKARKEM